MLKTRRKLRTERIQGLENRESRRDGYVVGNEVR